MAYRSGIPVGMLVVPALEEDPTPEIPPPLVGEDIPLPENRPRRR
jgi:hypothetical protein